MLISSTTLFHLQSVSGELYCPGNAKDMNDESSMNNVAYVFFNPRSYSHLFNKIDKLQVREGRMDDHG